MTDLIVSLQFLKVTIKKEKIVTKNVSISFRKLSLRETINRFNQQRRKHMRLAIHEELKNITKKDMIKYLKELDDNF